MTPIERAARALCKLAGSPENIQFEGKPMWQSYIGEARVVIEAIRVPGDIALGAGAKSLLGIRPSKVFEAQATWEAMIDAMLKNPVS